MDASFFMVSGLVLLFTVGPVLLIVCLVSFSIKSSQKKAIEFDNAMLAKIRINDPNFDLESFKRSANICIQEVFNCFYNLDIEKLRLLESSDLFEIHRMDIETGILSGHLLILDLPENMNFRISNYYIDGDKEIICCSASITSKDKEIDPSTKEKLGDNVPSFVLHTMNLEFARCLGVKTIFGKEFVFHECPNCGAGVSVNVYGKCTYCDTVIVNGQHSWVLNKISDSFTN